ncbi:MAG: DoxX family protein [Chloroflexi bacterium]|nr:MAG: hypothetical protein CUN54_00070 [Phototrophicales bacterium]RMF79661.1 MAG: DoxX family protein [Chloroflexota bacterium]
MFLSDSLTVEHWLAILRIAVGLWWIKSVFHKDLSKFINGGMMGWTLSLADNHPVPAFGRALRGLLTINETMFPYLIVLGELGVGIGITFGFFTPVALIVAIFLNLNYLATAGVKPKDINVNPCFRVDQGQNVVMIASEVVMLATGAWAVWSIDNILNIFPV